MDSARADAQKQAGAEVCRVYGGHGRPGVRGDLRDHGGGGQAGGL